MINDYYSGHKCGCVTASKTAIDKKVFDKAIRDYFDGKMQAGDIHHKLWEATYRAIGNGVLSGAGKIKYTTDDIALVNELKTNAAVFAAFKNHQQSKAITALLVDENGKRRSWQAFKKEAQAIHGQYNVNWLQAEFNYATRAARSAIKWQEFERTKDIYPNLEYTRSRSGSPREAHKQYYGIVKPINDPFWDKVMPPNGWGCKCGIRKTKASPTSGSIQPIEPIPGIPGNPGKARVLITKDHPMVKKAKPTEKQSIKTQMHELVLEDDFARIPVAKKGNVNVHYMADKSDLLENKDFAVSMVKKLGKNVEIRIDVQDGRKNPELSFSKTIGDRTKWVNAGNVERYIQHSFRHKLSKNGQLKGLDKCWIGLDFDGKLSKTNYSDASRALWSKINHYETVDFVILKNGKKLIQVKRPKTYMELLDKIKKELL